MRLNTNKLTLLKVLLSASCVIYVFLLTRTVSQRQLIQRSDGQTISSISTGSRSTFAVFLLIQRLNESRSFSTGNADVLVNRLFKLPNCDATKSFRLYVLRFADEHAALTTKESLVNHLNESFKQCPRYVPISVDEFLIKDLSMDVRFLRDVILDAYLDNVDYYHIVLSDGITEMSKTDMDLSHLKDILLRRSPHGVGVIATMNSKESGSVSRLFFSKIHIEIFGAAFPFTNETLETVLSYTVWFYSSYHMATIIEGGKEILDDEAPKDLKTHEWTERCSQDSNTLHRYLSAMKVAQVFWRSISSNRNVIAMSLYGDNRRYTMGALRNAQLLPVVFPGWHLWFYVEKPLPDGSVRHGKTPEKILRKIEELGAEIRYVDTAVTGLAPMLWRFLVAEDLDVDAFAVRDCDSRLTPRDAIVIDNWLKTNASFHCIRDHPSHTWHPVSGGLWGGRPKALHRVIDGVTTQVMKLYGSEYFDDMRFLARQIWPKVKDVSYCHDSVSCDSFPNSHPFPVKRIGFEHLGQVYDENSQVKQYDIDIIAAAKVNTNCTPT